MGNFELSLQNLKTVGCRTLRLFIKAVAVLYVPILQTIVSKM
jgi:hypothetical protein